MVRRSSGNSEGTVAVIPAYDDDALASIKSFDDAWQMAQENGPVDSSDNYGTGFDVVEKEELVGKEMILLTCRVTLGQIGEFVSITAVTRANQKVVFNDGSTGILRQMMSVLNRKFGENGWQIGDEVVLNIHLRKGLRVSKYTYTDDEGKEKPAETFYLDF